VCCPFHFSWPAVQGGGPFVAFTEPSVPLVETLGSGRAVTAPGVEQAARNKSRASIQYRIFIYADFREIPLLYHGKGLARPQRVLLAADQGKKVKIVAKNPQLRCAISAINRLIS